MYILDDSTPGRTDTQTNTVSPVGAQHTRVESSASPREAPSPTRHRRFTRQIMDDVQDKEYETPRVERWASDAPLHNLYDQFRVDAVTSMADLEADPHEVIEAVYRANAVIALRETRRPKLVLMPWARYQDLVRSDADDAAPDADSSDMTFDKAPNGVTVESVPSRVPSWGRYQEMTGGTTPRTSDDAEDRRSDDPPPKKASHVPSWKRYTSMMWMPSSGSREEASGATGSDASNSEKKKRNASVAEPQEA